MRINLTGFTSAQTTGSNRKNILSLSNLLPSMLRDSGHTVGYGLEDADLNIVFVLDLGSINSSNATNCLELLKKEGYKSMIAFDDWNVKGFYKTIDKVLDTKKFSKSHHSVDYKEVLSNLDTLEKLANGEFKAIYPAYENGNHELLGIRGVKFNIDPSVYVEKEHNIAYVNSDLIAVHASLAPKWSFLNKKKYTILNVKNETEDDVFRYYIKHRIVLSPPHYHDGSGWWRNRYDLANRAKAVVIEDDNSVFGESYMIDRRAVTNKLIDELFRLQDEDYNKTIMTKNEVANRIKQILEAI